MTLQAQDWEPLYQQCVVCLHDEALPAQSAFTIVEFDSKPLRGTEYLGTFTIFGAQYKYMGTHLVQLLWNCQQQS